jgi:DNA-binding NarL/FixJ family response regulator
MLKLTARDREVCEELIKGKSNREIGEELGIEPGSVKARLHSIFLRNQLDDVEKHVRILLAIAYAKERAASV